MWVLLWLLFWSSWGLAAPILLNDLPLNPPLETRADLDATATESPLDERIALNAFERFGINVQTSSLDDALRLEVGTQRLDWRDGVWFSRAKLPHINSPTRKDNIVYLPLRCLETLGFELSVESGVVVVRSSFELPTGGFNQVFEVNVQKGNPSRVQLRFLRPPEFFTVQRTAKQHFIYIKNTASSPRFWSVGSSGLSRMRMYQAGKHTMLEAELPENVQTSLSSNANTLSFETTDPNVPLAVVPNTLPTGIEYKTVAGGLSKLHLVRLDPALYSPEVRTAPWGGARGILEFAMGAVAAVNGGYFDPASLLPVDLLFNGALYAYSRGNRATLGFFDQSTLFGIPRARLVLTLGETVGNINQIRPNPHPQNLTFFIGDGFVPVGGLGYTTLVLGGGKVLERYDAAFVPQVGQITISFNPKTNLMFERQIGEVASVALVWGDPQWQQVSGALAAGPRLVANGVFAVDPKAEGFDQNGEIWRPTRQIGFGVDKQGWYVLAMLEFGSPEDFAKALVANGLREALRLDSGSSAQLALAGGLVAGRLGRVVPNALVFVPR
jgi:Phosphodiester glycosidase